MEGMMKEFEIKTKIFFEENALDHLLHKKSDNTMIIADPFTIKSGIIKYVTDRLDQAGITYTLFDDVVADAPMDKVMIGIHAALEQMPDCLIAVGGGSAIDFTKAVRLFAHRINEEFWPRFVAIPTTSGTGSEVTQVSVVTDTENNVKVPLDAKELFPDEAILDAVLVKTVPKSVTADTGVDILTHAIESFVSIGCNDFSAAFAERSVKLCCRYLCRSYADSNDHEAREKIHTASCLAGMAFNAAGLGLNHGMAHQLGAMFHLPHGRANAILLPHIIRYNSGVNDLSTRGDHHLMPCIRKYCEIAASLGITNFDEVSTVRSLTNYLRIMIHEIDLPSCIEEIGTICKEEYFSAIDQMADATLLDATTQSNPRKPSKEDVVRLFEQIWSKD